MPNSAPAHAASSVRLRLPTGWVTLGPGRYEVGRSASCQIVLDGLKVSRLHALVMVEATGATIEDLGSANGTLVNGRRLSTARRALADGDTILLGEVELFVSFDPDPTLEESGAVVIRPRAERSEPPRAARSEPPTSGPVSSLSLLGAVAEQILAAGDARRAEGMLKPTLERTLESVRGGAIPEPTSSEAVLRHALGLGRALAAPSWLDFVFDYMSAVRWIPSEMQLAELERCLGSIVGVGPQPLERYLEVLRGLPTSMDKLRTQPRLERALDELRGKPSRP